MDPSPLTEDELEAELERSQDLGFLGPGPVSAHVEHSRAVTVGLPAGAPSSFLDLGSGGGLPGLVLAYVWPSATVVLLDAGERRCAYLVAAVERLGLEGRVTVVRGRAEEAGRDAALRGAFDLVVARSFGPPAVTAECGAPFLRVGGHLVVSEPPADSESHAGGAAVRWPADGLALLGLELGPSWREPFSYQSLVQGEICPDRYPRRTGMPAKRPLF
jgi:16S rRNA (guanine527-N7)-methyltransferase